MTASTLTTWTGQKTVSLTGHRRHLHKANQSATGFRAPLPVPHISFGPTALAASIARTATLRDAPPELLSYLKDSALSEAKAMISNGSVFALSSNIAFLADTERTHFAARMGAGITDLYMNALGYVWRDNAACLASTLDPHADFLYAGGPVTGHGVVLAEARGSFAANVTDAKIDAQARKKYVRQVRPYIAKPSPYGDVVHGYSLAFGSKPGTPGAFFRVSETKQPKPRPAPMTQVPLAVTGTVSARIALSSHRSNFILMDALAVVHWIDWIRGARALAPDEEPVGFFRLEYAGRAFLASSNLFWRFSMWMDDLIDHPLWYHRWLRDVPDIFPLSPPCFVIEERAGERFLNALSTLINAADRQLPDSLDLPSGDFIGLSTDGEISIVSRDGTPYDYALFRDGVALLGGPPPRRIAGRRIWHPSRGLE